MEQVADLLAAAAVADVAQRPPEVVGEHQYVKTPWSTLPICQGPAITPQRSTTARRPNALAYSVIKQLGGELRRAVQRARPVEREGLRDPVLGDARDRLLRCELEACRAPLCRRAALSGRDRIDAARREEDDLGAVASGQLEAVVRAEQVRADDVLRRAVDAGERGWLGGALDDARRPARAPVGRRARERRRGRTRHRPPQPRQVQLRSAALQVVERDDLPVRVAVRRARWRGSRRRSRPRRLRAPSRSNPIALVLGVSRAPRSLRDGLRRRLAR